MPTMDEQAVVIRKVLGKEQPFDETDLDLLRKNTGAASSLSGKSDYFVFRMEIELIHSILKLNQASTRLTTVAIAVAVVGVCFTLLQAGIAIASLLKH